MAMECIPEFLHNHMDRRPRKRPRLLGWDVLPSAMSEIGIICTQEVGNVTSFVSSDHTTSSSLFGKGVVRNGSPPWRDDDKDGHYVFAIGDNLTSRCNYTDFLRKNNYRSFPIDLVRELGRQLLESIAFMHDLHLVHTDLKPENILLVSPEYVKVPDLKGETLFKTHENLEHLAMMERVLGSIPSHMLKRVGYHTEKYIRKGRLNWPEGNLVMDHVDHSAGDLIGLLQGLLTFDSVDR
ncbi:hypothetical protein MKX01_024042 [Papaver californicum]|nr:hypothetical protein MKX01_024042 [Papaver californicum]